MLEKTFVFRRAEIPNDILREMWGLVGKLPDQQGIWSLQAADWDRIYAPLLDSQLNVATFLHWSVSARFRRWDKTQVDALIGEGVFREVSDFSRLWTEKT